MSDGRRCVDFEAGASAGCSRRAFLGQSAGLLAFAAAALGATPAEARAWAVAEVSGMASGTEHSYPLPQGDGVSIDRDTQVIIVRNAGAVYAFNLACPHENTALRWRQPAGRFQCPRHESRYQPDGTFIDGRATRNMDRFPVRRDGANLVVDLGRLLRSDQNAAEWTAAAVRL